MIPPYAMWCTLITSTTQSFGPGFFFSLFLMYDSRPWMTDIVTTLRAWTNDHFTNDDLRPARGLGLMTSFETKRHERHSLYGWQIIRCRQLDHWTGLRGDLWHSKAEEKRRRRAEDANNIRNIAESEAQLTRGVVDGRETRCLFTPFSFLKGRGVAERNWGLYGEANKARTRAGHRAIDGTLLRRNASEVKALYLSAAAEYNSFSRGQWAQEHFRRQCGLSRIPSNWKTRPLLHFC